MNQLPLLHLQPAAAEAAVVYIALSVSSASDVWCVSPAATLLYACSVRAALGTPTAVAHAAEQILKDFHLCFSRDFACFIRSVEEVRAGLHVGALVAQQSAPRGVQCE